MRVYISGKIGEEYPSPETLAKFKAVDDMLRGRGYEVFNPTTSGLGHDADEAVLQARDLGLETTWYAEILKLDLDALSFCDAIYLLEDWQQSPGAKSEYQFALATGKRVFFAGRAQAVMRAMGLNRKLEDVWLPLRKGKIK